MTHDLLALAEECESKLIGLAVIRAVAPQLGKTCDELTLTLSKIYAALRAAHEELRTAREAYTNIGSERDNLQLECDRLRKSIEDVRHKGFCATVKYACKGIEIENGVYSGNRDSIYKAFDNERNKQKDKWGSDNGKTISCFCNDIEQKLIAAKRFAYERNNASALCEIVKIGALAVAALEQLVGDHNGTI